MSKADVIMPAKDNKLISIGMAKYPNEALMHPRAYAEPSIVFPSPNTTVRAYDDLQLSVAPSSSSTITTTDGSRFDQINQTDPSSIIHRDGSIHGQASADAPIDTNNASRNVDGVRDAAQHPAPRRRGAVARERSTRRRRRRQCRSLRRGAIAPVVYESLDLDLWSDLVGGSISHLPSWPPRSGVVCACWASGFPYFPKEDHGRLVSSSRL